MNLTTRLISLSLVATLAACGDSTPPPAPAPAAAPSPEARPIQESMEANETAEHLLERANAALSDDRLFEPADDNALELYLRAIDRAEATSVDKGGAEETRSRRLSDSMGSSDIVTRTRLAVTDILPYGLVWVERSIRNDQLAEATRVIDLLERAQPGAASLQRLRDQVLEAETRVEREAARTAAAAAAAEAAAARAAAAPPTPAPTPATPAPARPVTPTPAPAQPTTPAPATPAPATPAAAPPKPAVLPEGQMPRLLTQPALRYPTQALRRGEEGTVLVSFEIRPDGSVGKVDVVRALPRGLFEKEAERVIEGMKFEPPGRTIQAERQIDFKLKG